MTPEELTRARALHRRGLKRDGALARRREQAHDDRPLQLAVPPGTRFLARAEQVEGPDAGPFVQAGAKLVWHTTEGSSVAGAIDAYRANDSFPHFTLDPRSGRLVQHIAMDRSARALEHPAGTVETNRAHAIQVELVGFAVQAPHWDAGDYARIARLAREIEAAAGVPRQAIARFDGSGRRLAADAWLRAAGHCGHCHVPHNNHADPGRLRIDWVL